MPTDDGFLHCEVVLIKVWTKDIHIIHTVKTSDACKRMYLLETSVVDEGTLPSR